MAPTRRTAAAVDDKPSKYELERLANIEHNESVLRSLGLISAPDVNTLRAASPATLGGKPPMPAEEVPRRRSLRLLDASPLNYSEPRLPAKRLRRASVAEDEPAPQSPSRPVIKAESAGRHAPGSATKSPPPGSIKMIDANVELLDREFVGHLIAPLGTQVKHAVMALAAGKLSVRFNRMSGIQEWRNAVFLFVNIGGDNYQNAFSDGGRLMRWFAQPSQTTSTPVLQRVIARECPVFLFCRLLGHPYRCLGRVQHDKHDASSSPVVFELQLCDYDKLKHLDGFAALLAVAAPDEASPPMKLEPE